MKKLGKLTALILAIFMMASFVAGCGNETEANSSTPSSTPTAQQSTAPVESADPVDEYAYRMPITDDVYTLTAWRAFTSAYLSDPNEIIANIELEKRTNIHIDWKLASTADQNAAYSIMIASNIYDDFIVQGRGEPPEYVGGIDKAIEDDVLMEVSSLIEKWMPNLKNLMETNVTIGKDIRTDSGNIGQFPVTKTELQPSWLGPGIRYDLLDNLGLAMPKTYDQLHDVLVKFRDDLSMPQPLILPATGYSDMAFSLESGFDTAPTFYQVDNVVKYGFIEDNFKEYTIMLNKWYSEKLIDQEFFTRTGSSDFTAIDRITNDLTGATVHMMQTMQPQYRAVSPNPDFMFRAMPFPQKVEGNVSHLSRPSYYVSNNGVTIPVTTAKDEYKLEVIARWVDYKYGEEGAILMNYGVEGVTYTMVDGQPLFNDFVTKNPDGIPASQMYRVACDSDWTGLYMWQRERAIMDEEDYAAYTIWSDSTKRDWTMPLIEMTATEGGEYTALYADIQTYVQETYPSFVTGTKPISEYDAFIQQLKSMNIDRCIELQQAALDRYNAR